MTSTREGQPAVIFVRFEQVGFHCWPDAPSHRAYLRASHRHLFGIEVTTRVDHDERDIEFHDLRDEAAALFRGLSNTQQISWRRRLAQILRGGRSLNIS